MEEIPCRYLPLAITYCGWHCSNIILVGPACQEIRCSILCKDLNQVDDDKVSEECRKEMFKILSMVIIKYHVSKAALHAVSIPMVQALIRSTDNKYWALSICYPSALHQTGFWWYTEKIHTYLSDPLQWWPPKAIDNCILFVGRPVLSLRLQQSS